MSIIFLSNLGPSERAEWHALLTAALPEETILPTDDIDRIPDPGDIDIAIVASPPPGRLARLPGLGLVQSAWAGVDALLADPTLPDVPLARLVDPYLASDMAEAALTHVLAVHRQAAAYARQQLSAEWRPLPQRRASQMRVGVLGLGEMGSASAALLHKVGFDVAGWSRSPRSAPTAYETLHGADGLATVLGRSDILVNLLPLTDETRGLLGKKTFAQLPQGAAIVNLGRGGHVVVPDLIDALASGHIRHAILDVFTVEPLPADDPLWRCDGVTITPHVAAETDPATASQVIAANIRRFRAGQPLTGLVERSRGY